MLTPPPSRNFNFDSVHVAGAKSIAHIAQESGVSKFIHVSHLNASLESTSEFYRSKAKGEIAVREAFPDASIVRPAAMFGYEDRLLNNMASTFAPALARLSCGPYDNVQSGRSGGSSTTLKQRSGPFTSWTSPKP